MSIASDRARFRLPELLRGLPDPHMSARLVDAIGLARARYLIFTAAEIDARPGRRDGTRRCRGAARRARHPRRRGHSSRSARTGPSARAVLKREINGRLPSADLGLFSQVSTDELLEGMASFVEKRAPDWHLDS